MKVKHFLGSILILFLIIACSRESTYEEQGIKTSKSAPKSLDIITANRGIEPPPDETLNPNDPPDIGDLFPDLPNDYILVALVGGGADYIDYFGSPFAVHASSGLTTKNYDREVEIYLTQGQDIIDVATVTIPAKETKSNHAAVSGCGQVRVRIANVFNLTNFSQDFSSVSRETDGYFASCDTAGRSLCDLVGSVDDIRDRFTINDKDKDGICKDEDPDDNNACNPNFGSCLWP